MYANYIFGCVSGDWGMKDELRFCLRKYEIDKTSGIVIPLEAEILNSAQDFNIFTLTE